GIVRMADRLCRCLAQHQHGAYQPMDLGARVDRGGGAAPPARGTADPLWAVAQRRCGDRAEQPRLRLGPEAAGPAMGTSPGGGFRGEGEAERAPAHRKARDAGEQYDAALPPLLNEALPPPR